jgi:glycosyltransferase involved in cell wall biosynthesis
VVVATHGRAPLLSRLIEALERQEDAPPFEVVLVDDGSPDATWSTIEGLEATARVAVRGVRLERQSGPAAARNAGWRATSSPRIAFTDDDCVPQPGWLRALADGLEDADVAQGLTRPDPAQRHLLGAFSRTMEVTTETGYYQTCNVAYRREVLERVGGFDDDLRQAGEDIELATRAQAAGARTTFRPHAVVHHDVRPSSLTQQLRSTRRWAGIVLAVRKQPVLRERLHHGFLWKRSHAPALLAGLGLVVAAGGKGSVRIAGAAAVAPYVRHRLQVEPLPNVGPRRRVLLLPAALVADLDEVAVLAAASVRYRTLVL